MVKDKYFVTCDFEGRLTVWDLIKILEPNEDGFFLYRNTEFKSSLYPNAAYTRFMGL